MEGTCYISCRLHLHPMTCILQKIAPIKQCSWIISNLLLNYTFEGEIPCCSWGSMLFSFYLNQAPSNYLIMDILLFFCLKASPYALLLIKTNALRKIGLLRLRLMLQEMDGFLQCLIVSLITAFETLIYLCLLTSSTSAIIRT